MKILSDEIITEVNVVFGVNEGTYSIYHFDMDDEKMCDCTGCWDTCGGCDGNNNEDGGGYNPPI